MSALNVCGSQWDNMVCSGQFGNEDCYTCGERIEWLVDARGVSMQIAGQRVADEFIQSCGQCGAQSGDTDLEYDGYNLVWQEDFNGNGEVNSSNWRPVVAGDGFGNNELQFYTDRTDNAWVSDGTLKIRARRENWQNREYTSAKLETRADWVYGKFHCRTRLIGTARGTWAAHWMMPTDSAYGIWPRSGEIDIMEHVGYDTGKFHGTVHTGAYYHSIGTQVGGSTSVDPLAWHTWTVEWRPNIMLFAVDDTVYQIFRKEGEDTQVWPFNQKFYVILNLAVGGDWGGQQGIDEQAFTGNGQIFEVDWVRVEQRNGAPSPPGPPTPTPTPPYPFPTPTPTPPTPTPPSSGGCCKFGSQCGDCGNDGTGWCHQSASNCAVCTGDFDAGGQAPSCGGPGPSPTPGGGNVYCDPSTSPAQYCPGGVRCPNCGSQACLCP